MITRLGLAAHLFPIGVCPSFFAGSFEMRIFNDSANDSGDSVYQNRVSLKSKTQNKIYASEARLLTSLNILRLKMAKNYVP